MEPSLANLLQWMDEEIVRLHSGATIKKGSGSNRHAVHAIGGGNKDQNPGPHNSNNDRSSNPDGWKTQCYVCKDAHYVDQCPWFKGMTSKERWEIVKEQRACFSCLKKSKGHTALNCLCKRECQEKNRDGSICKKPHHKPLHENARANQGNVVGFIQDNNKAILPVMSTTVSVFYDSGAQISMVRDAFAEELELEGKL